MRSKSGCDFAAPRKAEKKSMFFESDDLITVYRTALAFCQTDVVARVKARGEYALSFRYHAENAVLRQGNKVFEVKTGDLAFVPRVDYVRTADYDNLAAIHFTILNADFTDIETFSPSDPSVYEELFRKVGSAPSDRYVCQSALYGILAHIRKEKGSFLCGATAKKVLPATEKIRRGEDLNLLTVASLASDCGLSEPSFRKAFSEATGQTPAAAITRLKVDRAVEMIRAGGYKLDEIAERVGYCDSKYLSCVIKRITGISPREWAK